MSVNLIEDFLSEEDFNYFSNDSFDIFTNPETKYQTNLTAWKKELIENSSPILTYHFEEHSERKNKIVSIINNRFNMKLNKTAEIYYAFFTNGSYIPWHNDFNIDGAFTLYLSPWQKEFGGIFLYEENEIYTGIIPKPNTMVHINSFVDHTVTPILDGAPPRATMQIFNK